MTEEINEPQIFRDAELWPIKVSLVEGHDLFTLWGCAGEDDDLLLSSGGSIALFESLAALTEWLRRTRRSNLSNRAGYKMLRKYLKTADFPAYRLTRHDLREAYLTLRDFNVETIGREQASGLVNSLNLLWDVGHSLDDDVIKQALKGRRALATVLNEMTFYDPDVCEPPAGLSRYRPEMLAETYGSLFMRFLGRTRIHSV